MDDGEVGRGRRRSWSQRLDSGDEEEAEGNEMRARRGVRDEWIERRGSNDGVAALREETRERWIEGIGWG